MSTWQQRAQWIVPTVVLSLGATALVAVLLGSSEEGSKKSSEDGSSQPDSFLRADVGQVLGTVTEDGEPVAGLPVGLYNGGAARTPAHTDTTDSTGHFRFVAVEPGTSWIVQPVGNEVLGDSRRGWTYVPTAEVGLSLPTDRGVVGVELGVTGANSVRGTVVDGRGTPVVGIDVTASRPSDDVQLAVGFPADDVWASARTGTDGTYVLRGLPAGEWTVRAEQSWATDAPPPVGTLAGEGESMVQQARADTFHQISLGLDDPVAVADGEEAKVPDLVASSGRVLTGVVKDAAGKPVKGAEVTISMLQQRIPLATTTTDARGRYRFIRLKPTRVAVGATLSDGSVVWNGGGADPATSTPVRIRKKAMRTTVPLTFP